MLERILFVCCVCVLAASSDVKRTADNIIADGFPSETHHVTTTDGYILEMHRIPYGRSGTDATDRPVVFLMHGLLSASSAFIGLGAEYSLAYNLADAGFDVWMGNARGNSNSRRHINLNPDGDFEKYVFFDFTFEEIGLHDLPAMIDYILEHTGKQKLHYIGHSQGGTVFLVLGALRPDYNYKIASAHLLAAVGYQEYFPNGGLAVSAQSVDLIYNMALAMGIVELYPGYLENLAPSSGSKMADYCTGNLKHRQMCELFGVKHLTKDVSSTDEYLPASASLKQAAHYGQNVRDKLFRRYHHGLDGNLFEYGLEEPPLYDLGIIITDVTMHYTLNDDLLDERDVLAMVADMPNARARKVDRETFLHSDFIAALDAKELVTDYIIEALRNTSDTVEDQVSDVIDPVITVNHTTIGPNEEDDEEVDDLDIVTPTPVVVTTPESDSAASIIVNMYLILFSLYLILRR